MPNCARNISSNSYYLMNWIDEFGSFPAKISVRARMALYHEFRKALVGAKIYCDFKGSCFGQFRHIPDYFKFNGQLVHYMLLRCVKNDKNLHEIWFSVNDKPACFGLREFALITGLNCSAYPR